jgi:ABC-type dipeptide/oligopeptide/nickel transport system permease component
VVQGVVLMLAVAFIVVNLLVDLLYAYVDPRIRYN